ncbi:MAG: ATP-binding protein [Candidatus Riflebacteria bacterium]|nr:ATP-binding protein [Candidatus Riflebacteria bacterium]
MFELSDIFLLLPGYYIFIGGVCLIVLGTLLNTLPHQFQEKLNLKLMVPALVALGLSRIFMAFGSLLPDSFFHWFEAVARTLATLFLLEFSRRNFFVGSNFSRSFLLHLTTVAIIAGFYLYSNGKASLALIVIFAVIKILACLSGLKAYVSRFSENNFLSRACFLLGIPLVLAQSVMHFVSIADAKELFGLSDKGLQVFYYLDLAGLVTLVILVLVVRILREKSQKFFTRNSISLYTPATIALAIFMLTVFGLQLSHTVALNQNRQIEASMEKSIQSLIKIVDQRIAFASTSSAIMGAVPAISEYLTSPDEASYLQLDRFLNTFSAGNPGAICYIMNRQGIVVASSDLKPLFMGKDLAFREYFKQAMLGKRGLQIDIGVLTNTLGFYSSSAVRSGDDDEIVGVCAVKRNLDDLDKALKIYHPAMLLDASGTVFMASDRSFVGKTFPACSDRPLLTAPLREFGKVDLPGIDTRNYLCSIGHLETLNCKVAVFSPSEASLNQSWVLSVILLIVIIFVAVLSGIGRNIEALRSVEIAQNRFKLLFENAPESIFVVSLASLKILEANQSVSRQFHLAQSAVGMSYFDLMPSNRLNIANAWHSSSKQIFKHQRDFRKQNGDIFSAEVTGSIMEFNRERALLIILHDISAHREVENRLREAKNAAEEANALKARFFANASHEIRTPMTAITGLTELAASTCSDDRQRHLIDLIRISGKSMLSLLNDILELAQIETGKLTISPVQFNLPLLLNDLIEIIKFQAEKKSVKTRLEVASGIPQMVTADPDRIRQILLNLLANAVKYTRHGEISLSAGLSINESGVHSVEFAVSDTGIGLSEDMQQNLFGAFVFNDPYKKSEMQSGNLGLSISKQLIDLMGGSINVISRPGEGTTFKLSIPVVVEEVKMSSVADLSLTQIQLVKDGRPLHFLIADDNDINLFLASSIIERFKGTSTSVIDGVEALSALEKEHFDAILLDIQMPRLDGIATLKEIRQMTGAVSQIPVIAVSAFASEQEKNMARDAGAQSYLGKPYFPEDLLRVINDLLCLDSVSENEIPDPQPAVALVDSAAEVKTDDLALKQINRAELGLRILKKPENILQINEIFQRRSLILGKDLSDGLQTGDCGRLRETIHSIKGLAGMLAANSAFTLARELESLCADNDLARVAELAPQLMKSIDEIGEDLAALTAEITHKIS